MIKDIIVLAKSTKHYPNFCIAGIDVHTGEWVRPISDNIATEGAVPPEDILCEDGSAVQILDIVKINFIQHCPSDAQSENFLYDKNIPWKKIGTTTLQNVISQYGTDNDNYIFANSRKDLSDNELSGKSLMLVKIQNPFINIKTFERKKFQLCFDYNNSHYDYIRIEDSSIVKRFMSYKDGNYSLGNDVYAVFSLTGRYEKTGKFYKMVAHLFY